MCFSCIIDRYLMLNIHRQSTLLYIPAISLIFFLSNPKKLKAKVLSTIHKRVVFIHFFYSRMIWGKQKWSNGIIWQPKHYPIAISLHTKYSQSRSSDLLLFRSTGISKTSQSRIYRRKAILVLYSTIHLYLLKLNLKYDGRFF